MSQPTSHSPRARTELRLDELPTYDDLRTRTDAPPGSSWGLFGNDDQLGTLNLLRFNDLAAAAGEVRSGTAFSLDLPSTALRSSLAPTRSPIEHQIFERTPFHRDEWLDRFYTQYGSQLDGLRHIGHPEHGFYNGADSSRFVPGDELLSIHHITGLPVAGRAVLLDVDRYLRAHGDPIDQHSSRAVTAEELEATRSTQGTTVQPGDIVLIRFGWLHWYLHEATPAVQDGLRTEQFHPGLAQSHDVLAWLWDHRVSLVAADNFALEHWPAAPESPFFTREERVDGIRDPHSGIMHRALIGLLGMPIGELWNLDDLAAACVDDGRWSFLLTMAPLGVVGGVGSPANAVAMR